MPNSIEERVKTVIAECLAVDELNLTDKLVDLTMDSLDFMDIEFRLDKEFGFEFESESDSWETVNDVVDFVTKSTITT